MRTWLVVAALPALMAGCGAPPYPGTQPQGTVTGHVLSWPCAPVEIAGSPCPGRPAAGVELQFRRSGAVFGSVTTDSTGVYSIGLEPGTYSASIGNRRLIAGPASVTVNPGQVTTADFSYDSGLR